MRAFIDEWKHLLSGKILFIIVLVPIVVAAAFGYIFKNSQINEAPIAVVDLDHSVYSKQLISKLDASQYVQVQRVFENEIEADLLLYNEEFLAVVYLPVGLEANRLQGKQSNIGFYVDNTLAQATGNLRTGVTEVITAENAALAAGSLKGLGLTDSQVTGMTSSMMLQQRALYNPTNSTMMSSVIGFVNTIMVSLLGSSALSIVPRLRAEGRLNNELDRPMGIFVRVIPYAIVGCVSYILSIGLLKQVGGLRFEAGMLQMIIPLLLFTLSLGLLSMVIGWTAPNPQKASGRIIFLILPSFLLSGAQLPIALLPGPLQTVSKLLPLTWHFKFMRGMGYKGGELRYFIPELGVFLVLLSGLAAILFILILMEKRKLSKEQVKAEDTLMHSQESLVQS